MSFVKTLPGSTYHNLVPAGSFLRFYTYEKYIDIICIILLNVLSFKVKMQRSMDAGACRHFPCFLNTLFETAN